jgi:hypothetical protein
MKKLLFPLFLVVAFGGCKQKTVIEYRLPEFESEEVMRYEMVNDTLIVPSLVRFMDVYKDYLIMVYRSDQDQWLHIHEKKTGERIKSNLFSGRGPNEVIRPENVNFNPATGELAIYEQERSGIMLIQIDSLLADRFEPRRTTDTLFQMPNIETVFPLGTDRYLIRFREINGLDYRRFLLYDNGEITGRFEEYPTGNKIMSMVLYNFTKLPVSPDNSRFAIGTSSGAILEFFDISDGIERSSIHYFYEPKLKEDGLGISSEASGYGFMDMASDDRYVYGTYGAPGTQEIDKIAIFDWKGKPVKLLKTEDYRAMYPIAVDRSNRDLYAIARAYDGNIHIIRIKPF